MCLCACEGGGQTTGRISSRREREKLGAEIAALEALGIEQLKAHWRTLYETEPPARFSRDLLLQAVAYHIQAGAGRA